MNATQKYIVTKSLKEAPWKNSKILLGDLEAGILDLKRKNGKDIFVFGSAELSAELLRLGLVDEYRVCIVPVILGAGAPFLSPKMHR